MSSVQSSSGSEEEDGDLSLELTDHWGLQRYKHIMRTQCEKCSIWEAEGAWDSWSWGVGGAENGIGVRESMVC